MRRQMLEISRPFSKGATPVMDISVHRRATFEMVIDMLKAVKLSASKARVMSTSRLCFSNTTRYLSILVGCGFIEEKTQKERHTRPRRNYYITTEGDRFLNLWEKAVEPILIGIEQLEYTKQCGDKVRASERNGSRSA